MSDKPFALLVWCDSTALLGASTVRVQRVDTGEEVHLKSCCYLLQVSTETNAMITRGLIRHLGSGREFAFQTGQRLQDFVKECFFEDDE